MIVEKGYVSNTEAIEINVPRAELLGWLDRTPLSKILTPTEGMPAVAGTVMLEGDRWGEVGARRRIELSDGHYAVETVLSRTPARFSYQVWGFTSTAGQFTDYAIGEFVYDDEGETTLVTWIYQFKVKNTIARLPLGHFVRNQFQPFMENGLATMKAEAEAATKASTQ